MQRPGQATKAQQWDGELERRGVDAVDSEAEAGRARQGGLSAAGPSAVAGEARSRALLKGRSHSWGFL